MELTAKTLNTSGVYLLLANRCHGTFSYLRTTPVGLYWHGAAQYSITNISSSGLIVIYYSHSLLGEPARSALRGFETRCGAIFLPIIILTPATTLYRPQSQQYQEYLGTLQSGSGTINLTAMINISGTVFYTFGKYFA